MKPNYDLLRSSFLVIAVFAGLFSGSTKAQGCTSEVTIVLKNINGGFFEGKLVTLTQHSSGKTFEAASDESGKALFNLPCESVFSLEVENYPRAKDLKTPDFAAQFTRTLSYEADIIEKEKRFAMSDDQKVEVDRTASSLPDTLQLSGSPLSPPRSADHFAHVSITLKDIKNGPLAQESICLTGERRGKTICGTTNSRGFFQAYVPKGDRYSLNFKYHPGYSEFNAEYTLGSAHLEKSLSYLGTKEVERRKRLEEERIAAEERRLKEEEERFEAFCKERGLTIEEGRMYELKSFMAHSNFEDTVVSTVLNRNRWNDKLIVCDLTGSMTPYVAQLSMWFLLHHKVEKNLQFVLFNDGDDKPDHEKVIGETGGIYYLRSEGVYDPLAKMVARVSAAGYGGDCPENNMEALIKGVEMADDFRELVMIVDNNAPVKDIELLDEFDVPVHIILCGAAGRVLEDYLLIAWKTGGSIHTMEEDLFQIAKMAEGETLTINGISYRIMGGEFVQVTGM